MDRLDFELKFLESAAKYNLGDPQDGGVTVEKLADGAVTTAKISNNAVTQAKLASNLSGITICTASTRPAFPFEGQGIYETDTNRILFYDNAAWVVVADIDSPPGLQLIKTQTIGSAVTSIPVLNVFSSEFDNYKIVVSDGISSVATGALNLILGSTETGYYRSGAYVQYTATTVVGFANSNATSWAGVVEASTNNIAGSFELMAPFLTKNTTFQSVNAISRTDGYTLFMGGYLANTTSYTGFTLNASSGNVTGGTIRVYGYRNS